MNHMILFNLFIIMKSLKLIKEDFMKRKRVKNMVPVYERCCAKTSQWRTMYKKKKG